MGSVYPSIDDELRAWLLAQPMFFVATAPLDADGTINLSPKGLLRTFAVLGPNEVAYLDITGSGIETIAHLRENGRIVVMFCAFEGDPNIVRLHGRGRAVHPGDEGFDELAAAFDVPMPPSLRSIIKVDVSRVSDSCGFGVPYMDMKGYRDNFAKAEAHVTADEWVAYRAEHNATSIDGLPGLD